METNHRKLGKSDLMLSRIGFGAWAIGGEWEWGWGSQDDQISIQTIHKALEMGINWIDTAAVYGLGRSEKVVSEALKQTSYHPHVFTKCGLVWDAGNQVSNSLTRESVLAEVEASLKRLNIDTIDLYQIHWPIPDRDIEEAFGMMAEIQKTGKIRYLGVSNFSVEQIQRVENIAQITALQPPYSLLSREVETQILPYCLAQEIGVINYSPMASGLLSGKMTRERIKGLAEDDWRKRGDNFQEPGLTHNLALVEILRGIGHRHGATAGEAAIAWTLLNPAVTGAIVGMRSPDQVDGVIHAGEINLTGEDLAALNDFLGQSS
jgi:aryl-alcohol dehydrogenase-like predicted oxidoreductase